MADADRVVLKISYAEQLRRTQLSRKPLSILEVYEQISYLFPGVKDFSLHYVDDEGDKITVTTDAELQEAYNVCAPILRLILEVHSSSEAIVRPTGSLLHVEPRLEDIQRQEAERLLRERIEREEREQREKEERERREREEREQREKEERERREREERERIEREELARKEAERIEKERREREERERLEREEQERREREEREQREKEERERREREERERIEREELARKEAERIEKERREREEKLQVEAERRRELESLRAREEQAAKEAARDRMLQSNPKCGEALERLFSAGAELEIAWEALELSNYDEQRARSLLEMTAMGLDIRASSDALTKQNGNIEAAVNSLLM